MRAKSSQSPEELQEWAELNNPPYVFLICPSLRVPIWKNQKHMAGYLRLTDTEALNLLLQNDEVSGIVDEYLNEKDKKFGQPQSIGQSLPGHGTPSKVEGKGSGMNILVDTLFKALTKGDVINKAEIEEEGNLPLTKTHTKWGIATMKVSNTPRKMASLILTLVRVIQALDCIRPDSSQCDGPFLLGVASSEDFWRAYNFVYFYEANKSKLIAKTVQLAPKPASEIAYLQRYRGTRNEIIESDHEAAVEESAFLELSSDGEVVMEDPTPKPEEKAQTQHAYHENVKRLVVGPYKAHSKRPPLDRKIALAACGKFAKQVTVTYFVGWSSDDLSTHSNPPPPDDLVDFTQQATEQAQADEQLADMVEAILVDNTEQARQNFYEFQQKLNTVCAPIPPYELSCERLGLDLECPVISEGDIHTVNLNEDQPAVFFPSSFSF